MPTHAGSHTYMKIKEILISIGIILIGPAILFAQSSNSWKPVSIGGVTYLAPVVDTWGIKILGITGGAGCLQKDSTGIVTSTGTNCLTSSSVVTSIIAGTGISISGATGNVTITATGGGGGSGSSTWATSTIAGTPWLLNYSLNATDVVCIGSTTGTSSCSFFFDPNTQSTQIGKSATASTTINGKVTIPSLAQGLNYIGSGGLLTTISTSSAVSLSITGNAGTATALAANGTNCPAGFFPLGVDASGSSETCTSPFNFTVGSFVSTSTAIQFTQGLGSYSTTTINGLKLSDLLPGLAGIGGLGQVYSVATSSIKGSQITNDSSWISSIIADSPLSGSGTSASHLVISTAGTWSGNAGTATALAANGTNCSAGFYPLGVDASGNSESCTLTFLYPFTIGTDVSTTSVVRFQNGLESFSTTTINGLKLSDLSPGIAGIGGLGQIYSVSTSSIKTSQLTNDAGFITSTGVYPINSIITSNSFGALIATGTQLTVGNLLATTTTGWSIFLNDGVGIGTSSPSSPFLLNLSSSTVSQLSLGVGASVAQWVFRNAGGNFYLSTSTVAGTSTTSIAAFAINGSTGTTTLRGLDIQAFATSTSNVGFNITTGCYAIGGVCLSTSSGGGSGTVTSVIAGAGFQNQGLNIIGSGTLVGAIATATIPVVNPAGLAYWIKAGDATTPATLGTTATSTLTGGGPITVSNSPIIIGASGAVLGCATCLTTGAVITVAQGGTNATTFAPNSIITSDSAGTSLIATTSQLTVGSLISTSTDPSFFLGGLAIGTSTLKSLTSFSSNVARLLIASTSGSQLGLQGGVTDNIWKFRSIGSNFYIATTSSTSLSTTTGLGGALTILGATGNVGINDNTPDGSLEIVGNPNQPYFLLTNPLTNSDGDIVDVTAGGAFSIGSTTPPSLSSFLIASGSPQMTLGSNTAPDGGRLWNIGNYNGKFAISTSTGLLPNATTTALSIETNATSALYLGVAATVNFSQNVMLGVNGIGVFGTTTNIVSPAIVVIASSTQAQLSLQGEAGASPTNLRAVGGAFYISTSSPSSMATSTLPALGFTSGGTIILGDYADCTGTGNFLGVTTKLVTCDAIASDQRLKKSIEPMTHGLDVILGVHPKSWFWIDNNIPGIMTGDKAIQYGLIAQDLQKVAPELVTKIMPTYLTPDGTLTYNHDVITGILWNAVYEIAVQKGVVPLKRSMEENWQDFLIGILLVDFIIRRGKQLIKKQNG